MSTVVNGYMHESERIAHTEEKHLPGGWVVLKFGGTSVGKFAENIASIVKSGALRRKTRRKVTNTMQDWPPRQPHRYRLLRPQQQHEARRDDEPASPRRASR